MEENYTAFAYVYDTFMDNIPYDDWVQYITEILHSYGIQDGLVCELGCGTGNITRRMSRKGFEMIGIDLSEDMLSIAREKEMDEHGAMKGDILYLEQDMREFELFGTVAAIISLCDSMNYILEEDELKQIFILANTYLDPGGIFLFDLKTEYFYKHILGNKTIAENQEESSIIWENTYFEDTKINQYDVTIYQKVSHLFQRDEEIHLQKAYSLDKISRLMDEAGLEFINAYEYGTSLPPSETSERICIVAREKYQENKTYI